MVDRIRELQAERDTLTERVATLEQQLEQAREDLWAAWKHIDALEEDAEKAPTPRPE